MLQLLRRFEAESDQQATTADADDDEDENEYMDDLHERFADIDLDDADEEAIWALLSEEERKEFESLLQQHHDNGDDSNIPLPEYHPWWKDENSGFNKKFKIILQEDNHEEEERSMIPELPTPLPDLEAMMKSPPGPESDLIWSLMHTTMVYCYTMRHFLGDIREEIKDTASVVAKLCKSTLFSSAPGYAYGNPTEVLYDLVNDILDYEEGELASNNTSRRTGLTLVLLDDWLSLLENQDAAVRAVGDLWKLLEASTKEVDTPNRKSFFLATRKAYFYLGYAVYISKNHGLERTKLLAMAERDRLLLEEQSFDRQRKIAEQAMEMQQRQSKPKITNVL